MKHRIAISVLLGSALVGLIAVGTARTAAQSDARPAKNEPRSPKVEPTTLAFEGKAQVSLISGPEGGAYLSFSPLDVAAGYQIAFLTHGDAEPDDGGHVLKVDPWAHVSGTVALQFTPGARALDVSVTTEDGATLDRVFTLNRENKTSAEFLAVAEAFLTFMNTGTYPRMAQVEAEFAAAQEEDGVVAVEPVAPGDSCSCSTPSCNCSVSCSSAAVAAACACSGSICFCQCVLKAS